jgi:two-component system cell cycle sensor histidine kinase/response regulator CckA
MSIILTQSGHKVQTANSPGEALEIFRKSPQEFDVVVTDLTMPEMTGIKLASKIYSCRPELPVILMTGYEKNMENMGKCNIVRLLKKPIKFETIVSAINELIVSDKTA